MTGKIIKGIAGFYYVKTPAGVYECKAKGVFRKEKIKPLVGDDVEIDIISEEDMKGNVVDIYPRSSQLIRPAVANVDQALLIFAVMQPEPNLNLLDRFLVMMEQEELPVIIVFNKEDLATEDFKSQMRSIYGPAGYQLLFTSVAMGQGVDEVRALLKGKTTTVAGPSGVGKSSMINALTGGAHMETGELSEKIARGKNTTRHTQLLAIDQDTYIMDTPGFSSIFVPDIDTVDLYTLFPEFIEPAAGCRFTGCLHDREPDCGVKAAVAEGIIPQSRYDNYLQMLGEKNAQRKY